jgi:hypothetical protein
VKKILFITILLSNLIFAQKEIYYVNDNCENSFSLNDFGNMWTFDSVPADSFYARYGFKPTENWLEKMQKSALQFGDGCSAAFVSEDGLIMTNHHCARNSLSSVEQKGENLLWDGFYANSLKEERKIPEIFVDQLISISDVTKEIQNSIQNENSNDEKIARKNEKILEVEEKNSNGKDIIAKVISLYQGNKYSLYLYKRYFDVRLVMSPDFQIAATGWDWDNFTWPRYELDFMFFRAYDENGNPIKTKHFFPLAQKPINNGETVFVIGRPGSTDRLISVKELEFLRDFTYKQRLAGFNSLYATYFYLFENYPEKHSELLNMVMGMGNGRKSYGGRLFNLKNEKLLARKVDFETKLIENLRKDAKLSEKYFPIFQKIGNTIDEMEQVSNEVFILKNSYYFQPYQMQIANFIRTLAFQMNLPKEDRKLDFSDSNLQSTIEKNIQKTKFIGYDFEKEKHQTENYIAMLYEILGENHQIIKEVFGNLNRNEATKNILNSFLFDYEATTQIIVNIINRSEFPENNSFLKLSELSKTNIIMEKAEKLTKLDNDLTIFNNLYAEAVFEVFGSKISPDATSSLRISDGQVLGYEYNGTLAPGKTTFYGLWDKYLSFGSKPYPWGLHTKWQTPPAELDLSTPIGISSTNDIVGGNSGSSMINQKGEVVGLVHDGNLESLAGHFIFDVENNRTVATDIFGIIEALKFIYKTPNLVYELQNGKLVN